MYIKSISFGGFKSYREGSLGGDEFSPMVNAIVGKNGSGKSNFFAMVQFVLGQGRYKNISATERKTLLHEGTGKIFLSAVVEMVLDNSDGRLVTDSDAKEVTIRRVLGSKKDVYSVNNKNTSPAEVNALLEAAGFAPSNPYNIVEQGKIAAFATMRDHERFNLLKEIAGTKVYEDRREQSMKVLLQAESDMVQIDSTIAEIEGKLEELGEQREEYKVYQQLERKQRCLQYAMHTHTANQAMQQINTIDNEINKQVSGSQSAHEALQQKVAALKAFDKQTTALNATIIQLKRQKDLVIQERTGWVNRHAKIKVTLSNVSSGLKTEEEAKKNAEQAIKQLEKQVTAKEKELLADEKALSAKDEEVQKDLASLTEVQQRVDMLITKRGRHNQFSSRAERDAWLKKEISSLEGNLSKMKAEHTRLETEAQTTIPNKIKEKETEIKEKRAALADQEKKSGYTKQKGKIENLTKERDALADARRSLFREQSKVQQQIDTHGERYSSAQQRLNKTIPRDIRAGMASVSEILRSEKIEGVHGYVCDLFTVDKHLHTACDVMAGTSLFHIVVETNQVASKILQALNARKLPGRPSFYPLNRLNSRAKELPTTEDSFPLYSKLSFDDKFKAVFADLYGRVLVCTNLQAAGAHSKTHSCHCVLPNGDKVDSRGGISGGFRDVQVSRMGAAVEVQNLKEEGVSLREELANLVQKASEIDQQILAKRTNLQAAETSVEEYNRLREGESYGIRATERDIHELKETLRLATKSISQQQSYITGTQSAINAMTSEIKTEMAEKLTPQEATELSEKQAKLDEQKKVFSHKSAELETLRSKVTALRQLLSENLIKRRQQLLDKVSNLTNQSARDIVDDEKTTHEAALMKNRIDSLDQELAEVEKQLEKAVQEKSKQNEKSGKERAEASRISKKLAGDRSDLDHRKRQRVLLNNTYELAMEQIAKLGPLPTGVEEYEGKPLATLEKDFKATKSKMKGLTHINKKAYDQYSLGSDARDNLCKQRTARQNEKDTLEKLIEDLDSKKDEAVLRTFRQVKAGFATNFKDLVCHEGANAELVLQKADDGESHQTKRSKSKKAARVDEYVGVTVRVNFGVGGGVGGTGDKDLSRLSGGQKTLVSLALIFAIQQCDPAPFYLFDEIDAALDAEYRNNVARKIQALSKNAQFLMVSFKPEMVDIADRHFAITSKNRVSRLAKCTAQEAQNVLSMSDPGKAKRPFEEDEDLTQEL